MYGILINQSKALKDEKLKKGGYLDGVFKSQLVCTRRVWFWISLEYLNVVIF